MSQAGRSCSGTTVNGNLTSVTDVLNHTKYYTYDANHRLLSKTDYNGNRLITVMTREAWHTGTRTRSEP